MHPNVNVFEQMRGEENPMRATMSTRLAWGIVCAILTLVPVLAALPAKIAQAADPDCVTTGSTVVCTFFYTGAAQTWTVPPGVSEATFDAYGARGGNISTTILGGKGGRARATLALTPGAAVTIVVGGMGEDPGETNCSDSSAPSSVSGGFNGGGASGVSTSSPPCSGAGGGGASDVRIGGTDLAHRVLVAGGGGGAAPWGNDTSVAYGGGGGGLVGASGSDAFSNFHAGQGGNQDCSTGSGLLGIGGIGGNATLDSFYEESAGGGGGGWCGGAGGTTSSYKEAGGGGGGSGYGPVNVDFEPGINVGNGTVMVTFANPDLTPPTTTASYSNGYAPGGWSNQPVTVTLSAADNVGGSGVGATYYGLTNPLCNTATPQHCNLYGGPFTISNPNGAILTFFSIDIAGNVEAPQTVFVAIDMVAPVADPALTATLGNSGWYISPVTVTWNWSDNASGIDAANCPATSSSSVDGETTISGACADLAGNVATASLTVKIDQTPPTVTYTGNTGTYGVDEQIDISCTAADTSSGIATTTCADISGSAWTFGLGSHSYSASAIDNAGLTGTGSMSFTVVVSYDSLANLTCQFVDQPSLCSVLRYYLASAKWAEGRHVGLLQQRNLDLYSRMVSSLQGRGLTTQEAQTLLDLAQTLYPTVSRGR